MRRLTIAATALLICALPAAAEPRPPASVPSGLSPAAAQAAQVVDGFHAALARGDTQGALSVLSDEVLIFESGAVERSKAEYAAHHLAADAAFAQAVPSRRLKRAGRVEGPLAWITSEGRTTGAWKGKPVDRVTTETMVLRRQGSGWVIVHIHWSSGAAPKA